MPESNDIREKRIFSLAFERGVNKGEPEFRSRKRGREGSICLLSGRD